MIPHTQSATSLLSSPSVDSKQYHQHSSTRNPRWSYRHRKDRDRRKRCNRSHLRVHHPNLHVPLSISCLKKKNQRKSTLTACSSTRLDLFSNPMSSAVGPTSLYHLWEASDMSNVSQTSPRREKACFWRNFHLLRIIFGTRTET